MSYSNRNISDDELDELFRVAQMNEAAGPSFNADFWSEMEAMMPVQEKKRRIPIWWWTAASGLILFVLGTCFIFNSPFERGQESANFTNDQVDITTAVPSDSKGSELQQKDHLAELLANPEFVAFKKRYHTAEVKKSTLIYPITPHKSIQFIPPIAGYSEENVEEKKELDFELKTRPIVDQSYKQVLVVESKLRKENPLYIQFGASVGQSPLKIYNGGSEAVYGCFIGAGVHKEVQNMDLSAGINIRMETLRNLSWTEQQYANNASVNEVVKINQLYSFEMPLRLSFVANRTRFGFNFTPGIQAFYLGNKKTYQNAQLQTSERSFDVVKHSSSLTMEFGGHLGFMIRPKVELGLGINADVLRPFNPVYYSGNQLNFPVNGKLYLRRSF